MKSRWSPLALGVLAALSISVLAACTGGSTDTPTSLTGTWITACSPESSFVNEAGSRASSVSVSSGGDLLMHEYHWLNDACAGDPGAFMQSSGTLAVLADTVDTTFGPAPKADVNLTARQLTLYDGGFVQWFIENVGFGYGDWQAGVPKDILGLDTGGGSTPTGSGTLLLRQGNVLLVGDDSTVDRSGYPTQVQPDSALVSNPAVTPASVAGAWLGPCSEDSIPALNTQATLMRLTFSGSTVALLRTYFSGTSCDGSGAQAPSLPQASETMAMSVGSPYAGTLLTERGQATGWQLTLTGHTYTPLSAAAASGLNGSNNGAGAYGLTGDGQSTGWIPGVPVDVLALGVEADGVTPAITSQKVSAVLQDQRLYVRGGEGAGRTPTDALSGYPLSVGDDVFLLQRALTGFAPLAGSWYEGCQDSGGVWVTSWVTVSGSSATRTELAYSDPTTCAGDTTPTVMSFGLSLTGAVQTERGTAYRVQLALQPPGSGTACSLLLRAGDRLYAGEMQGAEGSDCQPGDYPSEVHDDFLSLDTSPIVSMPVASWQGPCRSETVDEFRESLTTLGEAIVVGTIHFAVGSGCGGTVVSQEQGGALISFEGATPVAEGNATRAIISVGALQAQKVLVKRMGDRLWVSDDVGVPPDTYPTMLKPGQPYERNF
jgi:hypothetical protein